MIREPCAARGLAIRRVFGAAQILRKQGLRFLPAASPEQKHEHALGWLTWLGAEGLGVVLALLNLVWVPIVVFAGIAIPGGILIFPTIASLGAVAE